MKYPYRVIKDGKLYLAGEEVPDDNDAVETITTTTPVEDVEHNISDTVVENTDEESTVEPVEEDVKKEFKPEPKYGKNQINRMSLSGLRDVAFECGIKDAPQKTGTELKKELIDLLGL